MPLPCPALTVIGFSALCLSAAPVLAQQAARAISPAFGAGDSFKAPPSAFEDPRRAERLAAAFDGIDNTAREFAASEHVPGAAWGIIVDGALVRTGTYGTRLAGSQAPVDADTVFRIASMTKSFTALAILALRDEGKLSLDDLAERYVPELRGLQYPTADSPRITIRHLLTHGAGFPEDNPWGDQQLAATEAEFSAMLARGIPFSNPPGVAYEYSNLGFAILGRVVSRVSGVPYGQFLATRVLQPLGMASTTLEPAHVPTERFARGYRWEDAAWKEEPALGDGAFGPMGGLLTSLRDLARYVGMHVAAWPARDGADTWPLKRAALREMQLLQRGAEATGGYGYGLRVTRSPSYGPVVSHGGGLPGFGSLMRWLPEHGVGFIALGNRTYTGWGVVADRAFALLAATGALRPRQPQPSPALVSAKEVVSRLVVQWDDELAEGVAAVNLFLDRSKERRRRELAALRGQLGACRAQDGFERVENALRGEWLLRCERGTARAAVTLAPTIPPSVQYLEVRASAGGDGR